MSSLFRALLRSDLSAARGLRGALLRHLQVLWLASRSLRDDRVQLRTARLSVVTLFSLVPFLALVFSLFKAFGGLEAFRARVEAVIYENIAVGSQESFIASLETFVGRIHGGALGSSAASCCSLPRCAWCTPSRRPSTSSGGCTSAVGSSTGSSPTGR